MSTVNRTEWLRERRTYLGGTDVAAIAGKGFRTPLEVYLEKIDDGPIDDTPPSRQAVVGSRLEADIIEWAKDDFGFDVRPATLVRDRANPFLGANPDFYIGDHAIGEIKTFGFNSKAHWGAPGTSEVPEDYYIQAVWYMGLTSRSVCHLIACDRGTLNLFPYEIPEDPELFEALKSLAIPFWTDCVVPRKPPALVAGDGENIARVFPVDNGEEVLSDQATDAIAERLKELEPKLKELETERETLRDALKIVIGPNRRLKCSVGTYTLATRAGNIAWKALAESFNPDPELVESFRAPSTRVLTVSYRGNK